MISKHWVYELSLVYFVSLLWSRSLPLPSREQPQIDGLGCPAYSEFAIDSTGLSGRFRTQVALVMTRVLMILLLLLGPALLRAQVHTVTYDPIVLNADVPETLTITALTNGVPTDLVMAFEGGDRRNFTHLGENLFTISVSHEEVMAGFDASDVNREFLGFMELWDEENYLVRLNIFVEIANDSIPDVFVDDIAPNVRLTPHLVNFYLPDIDIQAINLAEIGNLFYDHFPDEFDFLNIVSTPTVPRNRHYARIRNATLGTGVPIFDNSSAYGSSGRLLGFVMFPITSFFDLAEKTYSHEIGHHWIHFSTSPKLQGVRPHWPISSLAIGINGWQTSGQGLTFPWEIVPLGGDQYQLILLPAPAAEFNGMELYLMGLDSPDNAGSFIVFENQDQTACSGCVLDGPVVGFDVNDFIASEGERVPAWPNDQTLFRAATIIISKQRPLNDREMKFFDHFAARGGTSTPLPYSSGFAKGTTLPFNLATKSKGTLSTLISTALLDTIHKDGFE